MSQSGMVAALDFRMTPDMVSEFQAKTSTYEPEYGATTGGQLIVVTKSGTAQFHGSVYEYLQNKVLNATQWQIDRPPGDIRPRDNENDFGFSIGGPVKIPKIYNIDRVRTFFFFDYEGFRIAGNPVVPTLTLPTMKMRSGDFSEWPSPIYDPSTTRLNPSFDPNSGISAINPQYLRDPFPGNRIPANRIANSLAEQFYKYLPEPNKSGLIGNWISPKAAPSTVNNSNEWLVKIDQYAGTADHIAATVWRQVSPPVFDSLLPVEISSDTFGSPQDAWVERANWDHTFRPSLLNHFTFGYLNRNEGYGSMNYTYAGVLPQLVGAPSHAYPPQVTFGNGYAQMGNNTGSNLDGSTARPTFVFTNMVTWVKGRHTIKGGIEYRNIQGRVHLHGNESGSFDFEPEQTGLPTDSGSGNAVASFLLGAVKTGSISMYPYRSQYARQDAIIFHMGDTWKVTSRISLSYGLRWDRFSPSSEKYDNQSFFDRGPNPAAGNRPGRLAFAGTKWGAASAGVRYPEQNWNMGFAPRLGIAYAVNPKTVVRTGYGIFYNQAFYPGWNGGIAQDGLNNTTVLGSAGLGGLNPAFYWQDGFPIDRVTKPPFIDGGFLNGQAGPNYRPVDGNRLSYAQQWNFTIERQLPENTMVSVAYVGSKGTRLPSQISPLNILNPSLLNQYGNNLTSPFTAEGQTVAGVAEPYPGWYTQMTNNGCNPTVAQALVPYPQYCGSLTGLNENLGSSTYHSLQVKLEKRYSMGLYALVAYTHSKTLTSAAGVTQSTSTLWNGSSGPVISPYEQSRNKSLSPDDVPDTFSLAAVYQLPLGKGRRFISRARPMNWLIGGWETTATLRFSSGTPFWFRSSTCNVPPQFQAACIPTVLSGRNPFTVPVGSYDPGIGQPLFNTDAFEPVSNFTGVGYWGVGPRISGFRGQSYRNSDVGLAKRTRIGERVAFVIRAEAFNAFNWHNLTCAGNGGCQAFNTFLGDPNFGMWSGAVSTPRSVQLSARLEY